MKINKKMVIDSNGKPSEVIISYEDYQKIEEMLGLDLTDKEKMSIDKAKKHREKGDYSVYTKENDV